MTKTGMARLLFGNDEPPVIRKRFKILYGPPSLQDIDQALLCLHNPMGRNQPVEFMLCATEEVQMLLIAHPYVDRELVYVNLISYAMIKLSECGCLYTKSI